MQEIKIEYRVIESISGHLYVFYESSEDILGKLALSNLDRNYLMNSNSTCDIDVKNHYKLLNDKYMMLLMTNNPKYETHFHSISTKSGKYIANKLDTNVEKWENLKIL